MEERPNVTPELDGRGQANERLLPAAPLDSQPTILALIEKMALDPHADVEKLGKRCFCATGVMAQ